MMSTDIWKHLYNKEKLNIFQGNIVNVLIYFAVQSQHTLN